MSHRGGPVRVAETSKSDYGRCRGSRSGGSGNCEHQRRDALLAAMQRALPGLRDMGPHNLGRVPSSPTGNTS